MIAILVAKNEIVLEVCAVETKYMVRSRDKNAGKNHYININKISFERMEQIKYLGAT